MSLKNVNKQCEIYIYQLLTVTAHIQDASAIDGSQSWSPLLW